MNCQTVYDNLIINAQNRPVPDGYTERHHIIPRSLGGSDDQGNIVHLTAREHFIAHLLLAKIYGGPMIAAAWLLANLSGRKINARQYAWLKEAFSRRQSEINTGKRHTDETKKKISEVQKGKKLSEETKRKMSEAKKGKPKSEEHIRKVANALRGKKHTEEARKNMSEAHMGEKHHMFGKSQTPESVAKRAAANTGKNDPRKLRKKCARRQGAEFIQTKQNRK